MTTYIQIQSVTNGDETCVFDAGENELPASLLGSEIYFVYNAGVAEVVDVVGNTFAISLEKSDGYPDGAIDVDNPLTLGFYTVSDGEEQKDYFFLFGLTETTPIYNASFGGQGYLITFYDPDTNSFSIDGANAFELPEGSLINATINSKENAETKQFTYLGPNKLFSLGEQTFSEPIIFNNVRFSQYIVPKGYPPKQYDIQEYFYLLEEGKWPYRIIEANRIYYFPKITFREEEEISYETTISLYPPNTSLDPRYRGEDLPDPIAEIETTLTAQGRLLLLKENLEVASVEKQYSVFGILPGQDEFPVPAMVPSEEDADEFASLPFGTVLTWTYEDVEYNVTTNGNIFDKGRYIATAVDFGLVQPIFPEDDFLVNTTLNIEVYRKFTILGYDLDNNLIINETYDPANYDLTGFTLVTNLNLEILPIMP